MKIVLPFILTLFFVGFKKKDPIITIIDIGQLNRIELGKQLRIINKFSPKIVAMDFHLIPDSLDRDTVLVAELSKLKNSVQVVSLHEYIEEPNLWRHIESSHTKFFVKDIGFSNLTATDDKVLAKELPMKQTTIFNESIYSFSYVVAKNSFGVKSQFQNTGDKEIKLKLKRLGGNYKLITIHDLFSGNFKSDDINDKIVLLGYLGDKEDFFYLDKKKTKKINGVEVHAAIINEVIDL